MSAPKTVNCDDVMKTCEYCGYFGGYHKNAYFCDYLGMTGKRRGCDPAKCNKYKKKEKGGDQHKKFRKAFDQIDLYRY